MWRTKWHVEAGAEHIATSSMQGGSRLYRLAANEGGEYRLVDSVVQTDERNPNHLAYGIDVIGHSDSSSSSSQEFTLASCSFYDNLVQVWTATTHDDEVVA